MSGEKNLFFINLEKKHLLLWIKSCEMSKNKILATD
jgi:hypothetical protein